MKLAQASVVARNAAFNVAHDRIATLIEAWVPSLFQHQATAKLESHEGRQLLLDTVDSMLEAAEKADAQSGG